MKQQSRLQTRIRAAEKAKDAFLRAAAALTEPPLAGAVAFALLEASIGLLLLVEADDDAESARKIVTARLEAAMQAKS